MVLGQDRIVGLLVADRHLQIGQGRLALRGLASTRAGSTSARPRYSGDQSGFRAMARCELLDRLDGFVSLLIDMSELGMGQVTGPSSIGWLPGSRRRPRRAGRAGIG